MLVTPPSTGTARETFCSAVPRDIECWLYLKSTLRSVWPWGQELEGTSRKGPGVKELASKELRSSSDYLFTAPVGHQVDGAGVGSGETGDLRRSFRISEKEFQGI